MLFWGKVRVYGEFVGRGSWWVLVFERIIFCVVYLFYRRGERGSLNFEYSIFFLRVVFVLFYGSI